LRDRVQRLGLWFVPGELGFASVRLQSLQPFGAVGALEGGLRERDELDAVAREGGYPP
jgi:hypothetical protein